MHQLPEAFLTAVAAQFSPDLLSLDQADLETYGRDWTRVVAPAPSAIAFPRTTQEVADLLKLCTLHRIPVVPSGGRTGLAGGAVASRGELVVSLLRMNKIGPVDELARTVRVQAGAITEAVHHHCEPHGLTWPVDFASKGSSQVGGNISTNAGGVKVIRYGLTRHWVLGLQVVTMQGQVLELNHALEKNNTGLDLRQLFVGTEGTLGIVTEATLKLTRLPNELRVFFFGLTNLEKVFELFLSARKGPFEIAAFETLTQACIEALEKVRGLKAPFARPQPYYVLLEVERPDGPQAQEVLDKWVADLFESGVVADGTLAQSPREARELWELREGISETLSALGKAHKNDIALPVAALSEFVPKLDAFFRTRHPSVKVYVFGHIGDGNLHINALPPSEMSVEEFKTICESSDRELFELVRTYRGSISAEHGIGLLKKDALHFSRTAEEMAYLRAVKKVFDPNGLLNPGKIFD